jgi:hypothetical protein
VLLGLYDTSTSALEKGATACIMRTPPLHQTEGGGWVDVRRGHSVLRWGGYKSIRYLHHTSQPHHLQEGGGGTNKRGGVNANGPIVHSCGLE